MVIEFNVGSAGQNRNEPLHGTPPHNTIFLAGAEEDMELWISRRDDDMSRPVRGCEPFILRAGAIEFIYDFEAPLGGRLFDNNILTYELTGPDGLLLTWDVAKDIPAFPYPNPNDLAGAYPYPEGGGFNEDFYTRGAVWLKHLTFTKLSMPIDLANADSPNFKQTRSVIEPLNRRDPIVLSDTRRKNATTTLDIRTWSLEEAASLRELLADNSVLLLQVPEAERWGIINWWISVGDVTEERLWQEWAPFEGRVFHLPVEIVERPAGGIIAPDCCYWWKQRGMASYIAFDRQYENYGQLSACNVDFQNPPDPVDNEPAPVPGGGYEPDGGTYVPVATSSRTTNAGQYGTVGYSITYSPYAYFTDAGNYPALNHAALPLTVLSKVVNLTGGTRYKVDAQFQLFKPDQGGYFKAELRLTPGTTATPTSGTLLSTCAPTRTYAANERVNYLPVDEFTGQIPDFVTNNTGQYVLSWVLTGTVQSITTDTEYSSTSNFYMSVSAATPTTTKSGNPANNVTMSLAANLTEGTTYFVSATQYFKNAYEPTTFKARYTYGAATGTSPGLAVDTIGSSTSIGTTPQALTSSGSFTATTTGSWTVVAVVNSTSNVEDATEPGKAAIITIGTYV